MDVKPRDLGGAGPEDWPLSRGRAERSRQALCTVEVVGVTCLRQLFRPPVCAPPATTMLSVLARPAGAALRRSFSTSAQVGPTRGCLQAEAPPAWATWVLGSRAALIPGAALGRKAAGYRPAALAPWAGPDSEREVLKESPGERWRGKPPSSSPGPSEGLHSFRVKNPGL